MIIRGSTLVLLLFSLFLKTAAKKFLVPEKDYNEWQEFEEFREWKNFKSSTKTELVSSENRDSSREKENTEISPEKDTSEERNFEKPRSKEYEKKAYEKSKDFDIRKNYDKRDYERNKGFEKKKNYEKKNNYEKKRDYERIAQVEPDRNRNYPNDPPPINEAALMARYIVNEANWTSVATISSRRDIQSFPSANVISFSDGIIGNGSGIPYMYLTPLDFTAQDIFKDSRASLMMTLAQGRYCNKKNYDPMDPRCARVILTGKIKSMKNDSAEIEIAKKAVFGRHPWLENMPRDHHFFFAKLKIASIAMLDTFGGPKFVTVKDYLHPPLQNISAEFVRFKLEQSSDFDLVNPNIRLV